jgi:predicted amidophosphoribosyltransferase
MTDHRSPRDRVSDDVRPHNSDDTDNPDTFDPAEALQSLHLEVVQLEALANAASEAVVQLPFPPGREERRPFDRVYALVTKVADETNAMVSRGDKLIAALAAHLQRKQADA